MTRFSREEMIKFKLIHEAILGTSLYSECVIPQLLEENRILREGLNEITRRPKISDKEFHVMSHLDLIVRVKTVEDTAWETLAKADAVGKERE